MSILIALIVIVSNYVGVSSIASESKLIYFTLIAILGILKVITL